MLIAGEWITGSADRLAVRSPYSGEVVGELPTAGKDDVDRALAAAVHGARTMADVPAHGRAAMLDLAADLVDHDAAELASTITAEQGKTTHEARAEARRIGDILRLCAAEALHVYGEVLPMDATPGGTGRLGFTLREPCGVVAAVAPFNYPAILVIHKVAPALAAGNAVILKPASATPLTSLFLVRRLMDAGVPPLALQCLVGNGATVGAVLCADPRVRKVSFTGSREVGQAIARAAGPKPITCELGSNTAVVVLDDADLDVAAAALSHSPFVNAGQNCVSPQRVLVHATIVDELVERLRAGVDALRTGDPSDPATTVAPLIDAGEAERVDRWLMEAEQAGARLVRRGERDGAVMAPAIVIDPPTDAKVWREELFGPAVTVRSFTSDAEALELANDTSFGLSFGVYTRDVHRAVRFAREARTGIVHVNSPKGTTWRADVMPWGGRGDSGFGREGVKWAIAEMTEEKVVVLHPPA
jgi:acyl-CoA reductase-like NAD-dependent aldehyde dehydrogenase